ncbi:hypothetical protein BRD00_03500 [Halobacteriales archaeon QS_8_69_26]|nr:MAG: hypothetical protein BRD00_03500 [Halobacteriales archaeon QS_8_69_26]
MTGSPETGAGSRGGRESSGPPARRRILRATATLALAGVAGCVGDGGSGDGDDGGTTDAGTATGGTTATSTPATTTAADDGDELGFGPKCDDVENTVDGLSVGGCQSAVEGDLFVVTVTVSNDGDLETDLSEYDLLARYYDSTETDFTNEIETGTIRVQYPDGSGIPPGESIRARIEFDPKTASPGDIQVYVVTLRCTGFGDGVYCD